MAAKSARLGYLRAKENASMHRERALKEAAEAHTQGQFDLLVITAPPRGETGYG